MTRGRSFGPILTIAGAAIVVAAVIAGFVIVGGPGHARDRRLDKITVGRLADVMRIVQCAFNGSGVAPASVVSASNAIGWTDKDRQNIPCNYGIRPDQIAAADKGAPATPGDVSYKMLDDNSIRVCANFRLPYEGRNCTGVCYQSSEYSEWLEPRPAGVVCRDSTLEKTPIADTPY